MAENDCNLFCTSVRSVTRTKKDCDKRICIGFFSCEICHGGVSTRVGKKLQIVFNFLVILCTIGIHFMLKLASPKQNLLTIFVVLLDFQTFPDF